MVTFDGVNKLIICNIGTVSLNVKDMYSRWKDWMVISDNSKYQKAFRVVGGDPTVGTNIITPYFFLLNGWKIRPQEASHTLSVDGILLTDDSSDAFVDTLGAFRVGIKQIVPIYTETILVGNTGTSGGLTQTEHDKLMSTPTVPEIRAGFNASDFKGSLTTEQDIQLMSIPLMQDILDTLLSTGPSYVENGYVDVDYTLEDATNVSFLDELSNKVWNYNTRELTGGTGGVSSSDYLVPADLKPMFDSNDVTVVGAE